MQCWVGVQWGWKTGASPGLGSRYKTLEDRQGRAGQDMDMDIHGHTWAYMDMTWKRHSKHIMRWKVTCNDAARSTSTQHANFGQVCLFAAY